MPLHFEISHLDIGPVRPAAELAGNEINESGTRFPQRPLRAWFLGQLCACSVLP